MQNDHATIEQLSALLDGELADPEAGAVRAHLESCQVCREELERLHLTVKLLRTVPATALPRSFHLPRTEERRVPSILRFPAWMRPSPVGLRALAGVAAALMAVLIVGETFQPVAPQRGGVAALSRAPAPSETSAVPAAGENSTDRVAAQPELRAAAPAAGQAAAETAPALRSVPAPRGEEQPLAQPPPRDTSGGSSAPVDRAQPAEQPTSVPSPWANPGWLGIVLLAGLAMTLFVASFLVRRRA